MGQLLVNKGLKDLSELLSALFILQEVLLKRKDFEHPSEHILLYYNLVFWSYNGRDVDNIIPTSYQRCFTNVGATLINQPCIDVVLQTLNKHPSINIVSTFNQSPQCRYDVMKVMSIHLHIQPFSTFN